MSTTFVSMWLTFTPSTWKNTDSDSLYMLLLSTHGSYGSNLSLYVYKYFLIVIYDDRADFSILYMALRISIYNTFFNLSWNTLGTYFTRSIWNEILKSTPFYFHYYLVLYMFPIYWCLNEEIIYIYIVATSLSYLAPITDVIIILSR